MRLKLLRLGGPSQNESKLIKLYTVKINWLSQLHLYSTIFYWLKQPKIWLFQLFFVVLTKHENAPETTNLKLVFLTKFFYSVQSFK